MVKTNKTKIKKIWYTTRQLNAPERAPQVDGQLVGVRLPIFNFKSSKFPIAIDFEKNYLSPNIPKNHQKIRKTTQNVDMWDELRDLWLLETWPRFLR